MLILCILLHACHHRNDAPCEYIAPEFETEVVDFGGLEDEFILNYCP